MCTLAISIQIVYEILARATRQEKEIKGLQMERKKKILDGMSTGCYTIHWQIEFKFLKSKKKKAIDQNMFAKHMIYKRLVSRICKEFLQVTNKRTNNTVQ